MSDIEMTAVVTVITGLGILISFYSSIKKLIVDPQQKMTEELHRQHEDFRVQISKQNGDIQSLSEKISREQEELRRLSETVYDNRTRIVILEEKTKKGDER